MELDAVTMIPDTLISRETLVYVGFTEAKATELWSRWCNWPETGPRREVDPDDGGLQVSFLQFITGTLRCQTDVWEDDDSQWRACLDACGIDPTVQDAIMDPAFKYPRLSDTCIFWAIDTVEMRFAGLKDIQQISRERGRAMERQHA